MQFHYQVEKSDTQRALVITRMDTKISTKNVMMLVARELTETLPPLPCLSIYLFLVVLLVFQVSKVV